MAQTAQSVTPVTISVHDVTVLEGPAGTTGRAVVTVSLPVPAVQTVSVKAATANSTASADSDYTPAGPTTLGISPGQTAATLSVPVTGDSLAEGDERFVVNLFSPVGAALADAQGVVTILDEEGAPTISVGDTSVAEGAPGTTTGANFRVSLSPPAAHTVTVKVATADGTARAGSDYTGLALTTATFAPGETTKTVVVAVAADTVDEGDESFMMNLFSPGGAVLADAQGVALVGDSGILPGIALGPAMSISDARVVEGGPGTTAQAAFTISLSAPASLLLAVATTATANGTAADGSDYTGLPLLSTVTFALGETTKTLLVPVTGDSLAEGNETFVVDLSLPLGAVLADSQGLATILDEEGPPSIAVNNTTVTEEPPGATTSAVFTVSLSLPAPHRVTVNALTASGSATDGLDYTGVPRTTLVFAPGETAKTVVVPVLGDSVAENDESFLLYLFRPEGAIVADSQAVATITAARLAWAPPPLTSPTTITIDSDIIRARGLNGHKWFLDDAKDYEIRIGTVNTSYGVVLSGGRNVVVKGGYITIPWAGTYADNAAAYRDMAKRRALLVANQTGTVHIEGLLIDNALGDLSEGIQIQSPLASVQIQNVRVTDVHARDQVGYTDNHPDCVQPMGVKALRIDRFTCSTDAQAFYLDNGDGAIGSVEIRRTNVRGTLNTYPYLFHRVQRDATYRVVLSDFWVKPQPGDSLAGSVSNVQLQNGVYQGRFTASVARGVTATWPDDASITGKVSSGAPVSGDFVPASAVGPSYVSPGYLS